MPPHVMPRRPLLSVAVGWPWASLPRVVPTGHVLDSPVVGMKRRDVVVDALVSVLRTHLLCASIGNLKADGKRFSRMQVRARPPSLHNAAVKSEACFRNSNSCAYSGAVLYSAEV